VILDGIVMLIVAVIIANTLLMAVFERIREIGILAALGMKSRQIMQMFLFEALILGLAGIVVGVVLGSVGVAYLSNVGIPLGAAASAAGRNIALGSTMYAHFTPGTFMWLSVWTLVFVLLASLYPARFAARQEPVDALRSL
jgi:ABC-type antimicrobial peptide transport system permease subunit